MKLFLVFLFFATAAAEEEEWSGQLGWSEVDAARVAHLAEVSRLTEQHLGVMNSAFAQHNEIAPAIVATPVSAPKRASYSRDVEVAPVAHISEVSRLTGQHIGALNAAFAQHNQVIPAPAFVASPVSAPKHATYSRDVEITPVAHLSGGSRLTGQHIDAFNSAYARNNQVAPTFVATPVSAPKHASYSRDVEVAPVAHISEVSRLTEQHIGALNAAFAQNNQVAPNFVATPVSAPKRASYSREVEVTPVAHLSEVPRITGQHIDAFNSAYARKNQVAPAPAIVATRVSAPQRVSYSRQVEVARVAQLLEVPRSPRKPRVLALVRSTQSSPAVDSEDPSMAGFPIGRQPSRDHPEISTTVAPIASANARYVPNGRAFAGNQWSK